MVWCIVGTAEYQVGSTSSSQAKKLSALNPGVHATAAPAESDTPKGATDPGATGVRARPCCAGAFSRLTVGPTSVDRGSTEGQPRRGVSPTASERP